MNVISTAKDEATITISSNDLAFLQSALNEAMEALSENELRIRTGMTVEKAQSLIDEIKVVRSVIHDHR